MKRSRQLALVIVIALAFTVSLAHAAGSHENQRIQQGKITKNEAQHLVLKKFPGAKIGRCELERGRHESVWDVELVQAGGSGPVHVRVDGRSGRILP